MLNVAISEEKRRLLNLASSPWFVLGILLLVVAGGYDTLQSQLDTAQRTAMAYRDTLDVDVRIPVSQGQPYRLYQYLLGPPNVHEVRILAINATGVLHGHRSHLRRILETGGKVKILLLHPDSQAFKDRAKQEEKVEGRTGTANRIQEEWEASIAILRDTLNHLLEKYTLKELEGRFQIRLYKEEPDRSMIFVDRDEEEYRQGGETKTVRRSYILFNRYPLERALPGRASLSLLTDAEFVEYHETWETFNHLWEADDTSWYSLQKLESELRPFEEWLEYHETLKKFDELFEADKTHARGKLKDELTKLKAKL